ncbi:YcxB family protein [uncultured Tenacibaculum sp.]|uniref:YcxB family protein n=1 Tax=uncultured Tenacibaculum sp. TaxID=174713 RepID=UPI002619C575|nr:YcxB family protein [uncultured Tenacibaculum sp.]
MLKEIKIKPTFLVKDVFKVNVYLVFKTWKAWAILFFLIYFFIIKNDSDSLNIATLKSLGLVIGILAFFFSLYKKSKKLISENPRLKENIHFIFNQEYFEEKGETFSVKHYWKNIFKVEEKREWFLIYIKKSNAMIVRKDDLKEQITDFNKLIKDINLKA